MRRPAILAIDGGGSKMDAALLSRGGNVIAAHRVTSARYQQTGDDAFLGQIERAVAAVCTEAGIDPGRRPVADLGVFCLSGADLPQDDRRIGRGLRRHGWASGDLLRNDTFAVLRAGTERNWGVAVVCGYGTNCTGVAPDGRMLRFPAVGPISGDWGGASELGAAAAWYAVRAEDGRGPKTSLRTSVPAHFGFRRPRQLLEALYFGRMDEVRLSELAPTLFAAAADGDEVARSVVMRQADEIVTMAGTAIRRLRMRELDPDVVLGGGVFRTRWAPFFDRISEGIAQAAPGARVVRLTAPPVVGAAMLGLDELGAGLAARGRARAALTHARLTHHTAARAPRS